MKRDPYPNSLVEIREDLIGAHRSALDHLARPGTWFTGVQRLAVAREVRNVHNCELCSAQKDALSPNAVTGEHLNLSELSAPQVEIVHRVTTDASRLTRKWVQDVLAEGVSDAEYVEILTVTVTVVSIDTFARAIGAPLPELPDPLPGEPSRRRPASAISEIAWIPTVDMSLAELEEIEIYKQGKNNIRRAISLVTDDAREFWSMIDHQYLDGYQIADSRSDAKGRAISRAQIELLGSRVSAINQCFY